MSRARAGRTERPLKPAPGLRRFWPLLQSLVGVGLLVTLGMHLGAAPFREGLRAVGICTVLAALGIGVLTTVFSAWRWCLVARSLGLRLTLGRAVAECYRAQFLNSVLPAGVLGDLNRAVSHGRRAGDLGRSVRAVVIERMAGQAVLVSLSAAVLIVHPGVLMAIYDLVPGSWAAAPVSAARVATAGILAGILALVLVLGVRRSLRARSAERAVRPRRRRRPRLGTWLAVAVLSAAALLGYLTMFVIAARSAGSQAPVRELLPVLLPALLAMGLPLGIGGWGPREAVTTAAFAAVGLGAAQGLAVAVVYGAMSFVACLPGAGFLLLGLTRRGTRADVGPTTDQHVITDTATVITC